MSPGRKTEDMVSGSDSGEIELLHVGWFIFASLVPSEISAHWIMQLTLRAGPPPPIVVLHADLCGKFSNTPRMLY